MEKILMKKANVMFILLVFQKQGILLAQLTVLPWSEFYFVYWCKFTSCKLLIIKQLTCLVYKLAFLLASCIYLSVYSNIIQLFVI